MGIEANNKKIAMSENKNFAEQLPIPIYSGVNYDKAFREAIERMKTMEGKIDVAFQEKLRYPRNGRNPQYTRSEPKVSRNAPCPCGSGKKNKKCCNV